MITWLPTTLLGSLGAATHSKKTLMMGHHHNCKYYIFNYDGVPSSMSSLNRQQCQEGGGQPCPKHQLRGTSVAGKVLSEIMRS